MSSKVNSVKAHYYAGIGSRKTPGSILDVMSELAKELSQLGWVLRSGGAKGADSAFYSGVLQVNGNAEIFRPQDANSLSLELARKYHPNWDACSDYVKQLHARNGLIVLGQDLTTPAKIIVCWTPGGKVVGGTGQALRMAADYGIRVSNLAKPEDLNKVLCFFG